MNDAALVIFDLEITEDNDAILEHMRTMKQLREDPEAKHIVCLIHGFGDDRRELYEIPEVRAFCRRLTALGFISYLDYSTRLPPQPINLSLALGAMEIFLMGRDRMRKTIELTLADLDEISNAILEANHQADKLIGEPVFHSTPRSDP